jgi:hypothetical protein
MGALNKSRSSVLRLIDFYVAAGRLPADCLSAEERLHLEDLDARGMIDQPHALANFLAPAVRVEAPDEVVPDVSPLAWIRDPYYVGPNVAGSVWPKLEESFLRVFAPADGVPVSEVVCTGSIGWGKSMFVGLCMARQLFDLSRLRLPHKVLGTTPGTPIVLINLSVTGKQAKNSIFQYVKNVVDHSPYFRERFPRDDTLDAELRFPNQVVYQPGNSRETSAIGQNVISGAIDEANFLVSAAKAAHEKAMGDEDHALVLYRALVRRIRSRFLMSRGFRGRVFLCSSKTYEGSFLDSHIEKSKDVPGVVVFDYSQWEVRPSEMFSGEKFRVLVGAVGSRSRILDENETVAAGAKVIDVPVEYRSDFDLDLEGAIRDVAGVSTTTLQPFLDPVSVLRQMNPNPPDPIDPSRPLLSTPLVCPFQSTDLPDYVPSDLAGELFLPHTLAYEHVEKVRDAHARNGYREEKTWRPIRSPEEGRYVAIDLAITNDAAGFAVGYVAGEKLVKHRAKDDPTQFIEERLPIVVFELLGAFVAPAGGEIEAAHLRGLIYRLRDLGFYISQVSTDSFQSADTRQILTNEGLNVVETSVDTQIDPYEALRSAFSEGRVWYYPHAVALRELSRVQRVITKTKRAKIDHPARDPKNPRGQRGSKDVADAMAQVLHAITQVYISAANLPSPSRGIVE